jgi:hypothetical protein
MKTPLILTSIDLCSLSNRRLTRIGPYISLSLYALSIFFGGFFSGCDDTPSPKEECVGSDCAIACEETVEGCPSPPIDTSFQPTCLQIDGSMCLYNVELIDVEGRPNALTPGERFTLDSITLINLSQDRITLDSMSLRAQSGEVDLLEGESVALNPRGEAIGGPLNEEGELVGSPASADHRASCDRGILPPRSACLFRHSLPMSVTAEAPLNQSQTLRLSTQTQRGARGDFDIDLMVIDPDIGLTVSEIKLEESSRDGALTPGDRVRFPKIDLINESLIPFHHLRGVISSESEWVSVEGSGDRLPLIEADATVSCESSRVQTTHSGCSLSFMTPFTLDAQTPVGEVIEFTLSLMEGELPIGALVTFSFAVEALDVRLSWTSMNLVSDENRDLLTSPGETIMFNMIELMNAGASSVSLRGRVISESPLATVRDTSDVSIDLQRRSEAFFEPCSGHPLDEDRFDLSAEDEMEACTTSARLRVDISPEARIGEQVTFLMRVIDQSGVEHQLRRSILIVDPDIRLVVEALEVTQDTLDPDLSGGETGVISYLKVINEGTADAMSVRATVRATHEHLTFEANQTFEFMLNSMGADDENSGDCISIEYEPEAYCYKRLDLRFVLSEEIPLGERLTFWIDLEDGFGHTFSSAHDVIVF